MLDRTSSQDQSPNKRRQSQLDGTQCTLSSDYEHDPEDQDSQRTYSSLSMPPLRRQRACTPSEPPSDPEDLPDNSVSASLCESHDRHVVSLRKSFEAVTRPGIAASQVRLLEARRKHVEEADNRHSSDISDLEDEPQSSDSVPRSQDEPQLPYSFSHSETESQEPQISLSFEDDENSEPETQISLPDSEFESEYSQTARMTAAATAPGARNWLEHRKEAYLAASGKGGRNWTTYSTMSSGSRGYEEEMELR